ncbi:MAG: hypothetical protein KAJ75_07200 [Alphaproteobacteria bacterium]|nr:hypothetical protein [Alphaproteobacteria bacterium]
MFESGWSWINGTSEEEKNPDEKDVTVSFARCFSSRDGEKALSYLKSITSGRCLSPEVNAEVLRHLEGQRCLVSHISMLIEKGKS